MTCSAYAEIDKPKKLTMIDLAEYSREESNALGKELKRKIWNINQKFSHKVIRAHIWSYGISGLDLLNSNADRIKSLMSSNTDLFKVFPSLITLAYDKVGLKILNEIKQNKREFFKIRSDFQQNLSNNQAIIDYYINTLVFEHRDTFYQWYKDGKLFENLQKFVERLSKVFNISVPALISYYGPDIIYDQKAIDKAKEMKNLFGIDTYLMILAGGVDISEEKRKAIKGAIYQLNRYLGRNEILYIMKQKALNFFIKKDNTSSGVHTLSRNAFALNRVISDSYINDIFGGYDYYKEIYVH